MAKVKTIGDAIREQMATVAQHREEFQRLESSDPAGTTKGKKFLELPDKERFNGAGLIYVAALEMLNEAVETVAGLMSDTDVLRSHPIGENNPKRDQAIMRAWNLLQVHGYLPDPPARKNYLKRCTCTHPRKAHHNGEGSCGKCACTWFHPFESG